jgi:hypothetical protein
MEEEVSLRRSILQVVPRSRSGALTNSRTISGFFSARVWEVETYDEK